LGSAVAKQIGKLLVAPERRTASALDELPPSGIDCQGYDAPIEDWKAEMFHDTPASLTRPARHRRNRHPDPLADADEPRLMSLVPPVHIVLLDAASIHNTFYEAMQREGWRMACRPTPCSSPARRKPPTSSRPWPMAPTARRNWSCC
jgi:L-lactate dehydrogenase complex protein LldG